MAHLCTTHARRRAVASLTVTGGQEFYFPHFPQILINFSYFSLSFTYFLPHFGSSGGPLAHPGRPWLRHWRDALLTCRFARIKHAGHLHFPYGGYPVNLYIFTIKFLYCSKHLLPNKYMNDVYKTNISCFHSSLWIKTMVPR